MRNVYGVADKVLAMALSGILIGAADVRPRWLEVGVHLIAVDTLVHNFLHRTGILARFKAAHPYGTGCYRAGGCAEIIARAAQQIDARAFNPSLPGHFPSVRPTRDLALLQPARLRHLQRQPAR